MYDSADLALDHKLMALIGLSSLSLSIMGFALFPRESPPKIVVAIVIAALILLGLIVLMTLWAWAASRYRAPGTRSEDPDHMHERYILAKPDVALSHLTADYLEIAMERKASTRRKGRVLNIGLALYLIQLACLARALVLSLLDQM